MDIKTVLAGIADVITSGINKDGDVSVKMKNNLVIIKSSDGYKWLAVYSNSFRDDDAVPEIISSKSHKDFVDGVNAGVYEYPELQLWHTPEWKFGQAVFVGYDEVSPGVLFAIAGGTIDVDKEYVAEALLESGIEWEMSHGMPTGSIRRLADDMTVYAKHVTYEVSVLPGEYAANHLTGFVVLEDDNMIPKNQKAEVLSKLGVGEDVLNELEESNKTVADKASLEREFKDTSETEAASSEVAEETVGGVGSADNQEAAEEVAEPATDESEDATEEQEEDADPANHGIDFQALILEQNKQMGDLIAQVAELKSASTSMAELMNIVANQMAEVKERVAEVEKSNEADLIAQTPRATDFYKERIDSILSNTKAAITDAESKELGEPEESDSKKSVTGFSVIDDLVAGSVMS